MNPALIDTDILSEFFRGNLSVTKKAEKYLDKFGQFNISLITYYEILNGLLYKDAKSQLQRFDSFTKINKIIPLTLKSVEISAKIFAELKKSGSPIGHTDTLIAGIAIANNLTLITNNLNHFSRIQGLKLANWKS